MTSLIIYCAATCIAIGGLAIGIFVAGMCGVSSAADKQMRLK